MGLAIHSQLAESSQSGLEAMYRHFWTGGPANGHFQNYCMLVLWEVAMGMLAMETEYHATHDEEIQARFVSEWKYLQELLPPNEMTGPHTACNPACDDTAWSAMCLMSIYRMTGDRKALELAAKTVKQSYDFWQDESVDNGLWYRFGDDMTAREYGWTKSVYCAGLILSALEYHEATVGTPLQDDALFDRTLRLYQWIEQYLRRDGHKNFRGFEVEVNDKYYFCDFVDNRDTGAFHPAGGAHPECIYEANSCSCLFGNTAMAVINAKLYDMLGDEVYLKKSIETANALAQSPYNHGGIFLNDRDAWTNCSFMGHFVQLVLPRDGIDPQLKQILKNTALSIAEKCKTPEGFYYPEWSGGWRWTGRENAHTQPDQLKTMGTNVHMITSAHLAESRGL